MNEPSANPNPEDLLRKAPRNAPSASLDQNMDALFKEARQSANHRSGWWQAGIPAWATGLACLLCLFAGMQLAPPGSAMQTQQQEQAQAPVPPEPEVAPAEREAPDQPAVLVQVARSASSNQSSPFIRNQARRESRLPRAWTVSP